MGASGDWWRELALLRAQVDGIDRWTRERAVTLARAQQTASLSREQRLDLRRRVDVLARQHRALVQRTDVPLDGGWWSSSRPRVVLVQAHDEARRRLARALERSGATVLLAGTNGAEAVGISVAEQPDLVLVGARVQMMASEDVVRDVRRFAPRAAVVMQVTDDRQRAGALDAGATTTLPDLSPAASSAD